MSQDALDLDGMGQAARVASGAMSAPELLEAAIARIERINPSVNAVSIRLYDEARARLRQQRPQGPFAGVPLLVKDFYCHLAGTATTNGSRMFLNNIIDHDSELMRRYRRAGFVTLGKTNVPEMVSMGTTEPAHYGPTRNPWALDHSAGGSSGGAAAAVASGMVAIAHANDGAGSIRIPASHCGLFGLKPSRGRITLGPDVGESLGGITAEHVITRSVRDSAAVLDATQGPMAGDPYVAPVVDHAFLAHQTAPRRPLRIAVSDRALFRVDMHPACREAIEHAAALLAELGHTVEFVQPKLDGDAFHQALRTFWPLTVTRGITAAAMARSLPVSELVRGFEPFNQHLFSLGVGRRAVDYLSDLSVFQNLTRSLGRFLESYDVWLTPTLAYPSPKLGHYDADKLGAETAFDRVIESFAFTAPANVSGVPAASIPFARTDAGLPVGIQIMAKLGAEAVLLQLAAAIEEARPWAGSYPTFN
jgi:amidase